MASPVPLIRAAMDSARHPALLIVDMISSLGSVEYKHDEWGVDVTIWCSQKGMMLPPGLDMNAVSEKALAAVAAGPPAAQLLGLAAGAGGGGPGCSPTPPPPTCCSGCARPWPCSMREACPPSSPGTRGTRKRPAERSAAGDLIVCQNPEDYSGTLTAIMVPDGHDADRVRRLILDRYNMSLGAGLAGCGRVFRIGHLGISATCRWPAPVRGGDGAGPGGSTHRSRRGQRRTRLPRVRRMTGAAGWRRRRDAADEAAAE